MAKTKRAETVRTAPALPTIEAALADSARFQIRAGVGLVVRIILLAVLVTVLRMQNPAWNAASPLLHAGATVLAVWPTFTRWGKLWAGRIRLAARYGDANRWDDAAQLLAPLARPTARAFDARREGTLLLARAWQAQNRPEDAARLYEAITREARDPVVREQAELHLRTSKQKETAP